MTLICQVIHNSRIFFGKFYNYELSVNKFWIDKLTYFWPHNSIIVPSKYFFRHVFPSSFTLYLTKAIFPPAIYMCKIYVSSYWPIIRACTIPSPYILYIILLLYNDIIYIIYMVISTLYLYMYIYTFSHNAIYPL